MPTIVQLHGVGFTVETPAEGLKVLVLTDPQSGFVYQIPMPDEAAEEMAKQLRGSGIVVATADQVPGKGGKPIIELPS